MPNSSSIHTDQIIVSLRADGTVRGINVYAVATVLDADGQPAGAVPLAPRDATADDVAGLLAPALVAQQGQIADLTAQCQAAQEAVATKQARIEELEAQLAAATPPAPPTGGTDALLNQLNTLFATVPAEYQGQFAGPYAIVRVLVQAGQPALAAAVVQGVEVPEALTAIKAQLLAALA